MQDERKHGQNHELITFKMFLSIQPVILSLKRETNAKSSYDNQTILSAISSWVDNSC